MRRMTRSMVAGSNTIPAGRGTSPWRSTHTCPSGLTMISTTVASWSQGPTGPSAVVSMASKRVSEVCMAVSFRSPGGLPDAGRRAEAMLQGFDRLGIPLFLAPDGVLGLARRDVPQVRHEQLELHADQFGEERDVLGQCRHPSGAPLHVLGDIPRVVRPEQEEHRFLHHRTHRYALVFGKHVQLVLHFARKPYVGIDAITCCPRAHNKWPSSIAPSSSGIASSSWPARSRGGPSSSSSSSTAARGGASPACCALAPSVSQGLGARGGTSGASTAGALRTRAASAPSAKYRSFCARIGGCPARSTISSWGPNCITSPGVGSGRAASCAERSCRSYMSAQRRPL